MFHLQWMELFHNVRPLPEVEQSHPEHHQNKSEGLHTGKNFRKREN